MKKEKFTHADLFEGLSLITQIMSAVVVTVVLAVLLASFLKKQFSTPDWVDAVIVFVAFAAAINSCIGIFKTYFKRRERREKGDKQ